MESNHQKHPSHSITTYKHPSGFRLFSFETVLLNNWFVKASLSSADTIFIVLQNIETGEVVTGFFIDENKANEFVNFYSKIDK